jgi:glyoxalase family protein
LGIHHVTAIAADPQRNINFYTGMLGLRLVKLTVNFDDPTAYHLYYGDEAGHPGTILTFFSWPGAPRGQIGNGQLTVTSFSVPKTSISYWSERLRSHGVTFQGPSERFDEEVISFSDPDGLQLELVTQAGQGEQRTWKGGPVPSEHGIRGFFGVTLSEADGDPTSSLLVDTLGFYRINKQDGRFRFKAGLGGPGTTVDVLQRPDEPDGMVSVGTVHHVAWRTPTYDQQLSWRSKIARAGLNVTPIIDRKYFHSIYFREPGGILFEVATDPPGFAVDEPAESLGTSLKLPSWLESSRKEIEQALPPVSVPGLARV